MGKLLFRAHDALSCLAAGKDRVNDIKNRGGGAERYFHVNFAERCITVKEIVAHFFKFPRVGSLERKNRLFAVADDKNGRAGVFNAAAGKELIGQCFDDGPLRGRSILRFVNQYVINAAVQFVQYPFGDTGRFKQAARQHNQVVIIHFGTAFFVLPVAFENFGRKG